MPAPPPKHNCCNAPIQPDQGCSPAPTGTTPETVTHRYSFPASEESTWLTLRMPDSTPVPRGTKLRAKSPGASGHAPSDRGAMTLPSAVLSVTGRYRISPTKDCIATMPLHCGCPSENQLCARHAGGITLQRGYTPIEQIPVTGRYRPEHVTECPLCSSRRYPGNASIPPRR